MPILSPDGRNSTTRRQGTSDGKSVLNREFNGPTLLELPQNVGLRIPTRYNHREGWVELRCDRSNRHDVTMHFVSKG